MSKNDDEVLVRVEGVSKKFCRSLKKSLWYGVCDIASELNPFGRTAAFAQDSFAGYDAEFGADQGDPGPERRARRNRVPQVGPQGFAGRATRKPNFDRGRGLGGGRRGVSKNE